MQLKISGAVALVSTLLLLVPAMRADPIRAPTQAGFETTAAIRPVLANSGSTQRSFRHDDDWRSVPESGTTLTLVLLAAGLWLFRKRMIATR